MLQPASTGLIENRTNRRPGPKLRLKNGLMNLPRSRIDRYGSSYCSRHRNRNVDPVLEVFSSRSSIVWELDIMTARLRTQNRHESHASTGKSLSRSQSPLSLQSSLD